MLDKQAQAAVNMMAKRQFDDRLRAAAAASPERDHFPERSPTKKPKHGAGAYAAAAAAAAARSSAAVCSSGGKAAGSSGGGAASSRGKKGAPKHAAAMRKALRASSSRLQQQASPSTAAAAAGAGNWPAEQQGQQDAHMGPGASDSRSSSPHRASPTRTPVSAAAASTATGSCGSPGSAGSTPVISAVSKAEGAATALVQFWVSCMAGLLWL